MAAHVSLGQRRWLLLCPVRLPSTALGEGVTRGLCFMCVSGSLYETSDVSVVVSRLFFSPVADAAQQDSRECLLPGPFLSPRSHSPHLPPSYCQLPAPFLKSFPLSFLDFFSAVSSNGRPLTNYQLMRTSFSSYTANRLTKKKKGCEGVMFKDIFWKPGCLEGCLPDSQVFKIVLVDINLMSPKCVNLHTLFKLLSAKLFYLP